MMLFTDFQREHYLLLDALSNRSSGENLEQGLKLQTQVEEYIMKVTRAGYSIGNLNEREQLRAILRFWATFICEWTGKYPLIEMSPASPAAQEEANSQQFLSILRVALEKRGNGEELT